MPLRELEEPGENTPKHKHHRWLNSLLPRSESFPDKSQELLGKCEENQHGDTARCPYAATRRPGEDRQDPSSVNVAGPRTLLGLEGGYPADWCLLP